MNETKKKTIEDEACNKPPKKVTSWVKKTLLTGAGAVFMTEEGIRNALLDMNLPKNVIAAALAQADRTKREISRMIADEVRDFLDRMKVEDIIRKVLAGQSVEISATIKFADTKKFDKKRRLKNRQKIDL